MKQWINNSTRIGKCLQCWKQYIFSDVPVMPAEHLCIIWASIDRPSCVYYYTET